MGEGRAGDPGLIDLVEESERGERIAKALARRGVASRREVERMIEAGRIRLDGAPVKTPATFVTGQSRIEIDGKPVEAADRARLWLYHKPKGLITTHRDPQGRPTVFDHLPPELPRVVSVGRLDLATEGLLLLTNDGALAHHLESPKTGWIRRYRARAYGAIPAEKLAGLAKGVTVDGIRYGPIRIEREATPEGRTAKNAWYAVSLSEGKNREIRIVLDHIGLSVSRLIRISYGPFHLGKVKPGEIREVPAKALKESIGKDVLGDKERHAHRRR
jgi:23S rRNA pseudouridine2605 synthase